MEADAADGSHQIKEIQSTGDQHNRKFLPKAEIRIGKSRDNNCAEENLSSGKHNRKQDFVLF